MPRFQANGGFVFVAAATLAAVPLSLLIPDRYAALPDAGGKSFPLPARGWVALAAMLLIGAASGAVGIYIVPLAHQAGLSTEIGGLANSVSLAAQVAGGALAIALRRQRALFPRSSWLRRLAFLMVWFDYGFHQPAWLFIAASGLFGFMLLLIGPFFVPMTIDADPQPAQRRADRRGAAVRRRARARCWPRSASATPMCAACSFLGGGLAVGGPGPGRLAALQRQQGPSHDRLLHRPDQRSRPASALRCTPARPPATASLEIARVGAERRVVQRRTVTVGDHPRPPHADAEGCGWPACCTVTVGADWHVRLLRRPAQRRRRRARRTISSACARRAGRPGSRAVLVLTTNTLFAYNYWGGASAYAHVESLMAREAEPAGGDGERHRPALHPAADRAAADRAAGRTCRGWSTCASAASRSGRGPGRRPAPGPGRTARAPMTARPASSTSGSTPSCAGPRARAIGFDYLTDYDLDADPAALDPYQAVILVGHSEYWSGPQRDAIDGFVDRGGRLAIFSGNTAFWKVRWEDDGRTLVCHKWKGFEAEARRRRPTPPTSGRTPRSRGRRRRPPG